MRISVVKGSEVSAAKRPLSEKDIKNHQRLTVLGERVGAYGFPLIVLPWPFLQEPVSTPSISGADIIIFVSMVAFTPVLHELLHILALPQRILRDDSILFIRCDGYKSSLMFRPGGPLNGLQFAWVCLLPLLVLTIIPYVLTLNGYISSLHFGILAGYNFGLSGIDIIQAIAILREAAFKKISD